MVTIDSSKPLIVQSDSTLLLDVHADRAELARADIAAFSELEKSPEHMHTYRISPLSLWNAASAGFDAQAVIDRLETWTKFPIPENIIFTVRETIDRFGKLKLRATDLPNILFLEVEDPTIKAELRSQRKLAKMLTEVDEGFHVRLLDRGTIKQELIRIGYPVKDEAPLVKGQPLEVQLRETTEAGVPFSVRDYQREAANAFYARGEAGAGFGTVVLPCGAGKTVVGIAVMSILRTNTLIVSTNVAAVHQWIDELEDKTELTREEIGEYTGAHKEIRRQLIENNRVEAVLSLPGGVFQPYSGVKTSVLLFKKGGSTERVLFLHVDNDGYKLDANHDTPIEADDLPELLATYAARDERAAAWVQREPKAPWHEKWWFADVAELRANEFNLSAGRYRPVNASTAEHRDPRELLDELAELEREIQAEVAALREALSQ